MGNATLNKLAASPDQTPSTPEQYNALIDALAGIFVMRDPITLVETDGTYDIGETSNGRPRNLNITGDLIKNGNIINVGNPIGTLISRFDSMPGIPAIDVNYMKCSGQIISNPLSPMNGQTLPNINGDPAGADTFSNGKKPVFIRGGVDAGVYKPNQNKSHIHIANSTSNITTHVVDTSNDKGSTIPTGDPGSNYTGIAFSLGGVSATVNAGYLDFTAGVVTTTTIDASTAGSPDESNPENVSAVVYMRIF